MFLKNIYIFIVITCIRIRFHFFQCELGFGSASKLLIKYKLFLLFKNVNKEKMFQIETEDRRESFVSVHNSELLFLDKSDMRIPYFV